MNRTSSHAIGQKSAQTLYYAFEQADRLGMPFNTHVTINFANTNCPPHDAVNVFGKIRQSGFKRWARRRGFSATSGYAFENARDGKPIFEVDDNHNIHVHWALHVPEKHAHDFEFALFKWVDALTGGVTDPDTVIKITHPDSLALRSYVLKGTNQGWADIYGATAKAQGLIVGGRRAGTTLNVGPTVRKATDKARGKRRTMPLRRQRSPAPKSYSY